VVLVSLHQVPLNYYCFVSSTEVAATLAAMPPKERAKRLVAVKSKVKNKSHCGIFP
jgi:hypothetical protein